MAGTFTTAQLSGGDVAVQLDQVLPAIGVTDWLYMTGMAEVQCTGIATGVTIQIERSTADPAGVANTAPFGAPVNGNPAGGMLVQQFEVGGASWWRIRVSALSGGAVAISLTGRGVETPAAIVQQRGTQ